MHRHAREADEETPWRIMEDAVGTDRTVHPHIGSGCPEFRFRNGGGSWILFRRRAGYRQQKDKDRYDRAFHAPRK